MSDKEQSKAMEVRKSTAIAVDQRGIVVRHVEDLQRLAAAMVRGGIAPKNDTPEMALGKMAFGMELGFSPIQSLSSIAFVNGTPSVYGDGLRALVLNCPRLEGAPEESFEGKPFEDSYAAICQLRRKGMGEFVGRFSVADAKRAKLWGKDNWQLYPEDMLRRRAFSRAARAGFADVLKGCYSMDELREGVTVIEHEPAEASLPTPREVRATEPVPPDDAPEQPEPRVEDAVVTEADVPQDAEEDLEDGNDPDLFGGELDHDALWREWGELRGQITAAQLSQIRKLIPNGKDGTTRYVTHKLPTEVLAAVVARARELLEV